MKVRMQTSLGTGGLVQTFREFGGFSTIYRGIGAPLGAATGINAVVFGSYGFSSRLYDQEFGTTTYDDDDDENLPTHDPWQKSMTCGSFAGAAQCLIICPMEHIKCRLQTQSAYQGSADAMRRIVTEHGWRRLYQGWWSTVWREIPAFGLYFAAYDHLKDRANTILLNRERQKMLLQGQSSDTTAVLTNTHTWLASAFAGGCAGSLTWALVYPVDVIKSQIQTAPLDTPLRDLRMWTVAQAIVSRHGYRYLFRGLGITLVRAFPVNGTIFPVYEFTLRQVSNWGV
jgi:Mitochondrial carrier protein